MPFSQMVRTALEAIRAHKFRSFLTTLGIVISVWTVVSVVSVINGMNDYVRLKVFSLSPDVFVVTKFGIITSREEFLEAIKRKDISEPEIRQLEQTCASCAEVGQFLSMSKPVHAGNRRIAGVQIAGTSANAVRLQGLDIEGGRFFSDLEDEGRAPVAIIGSEVRDELFPRQDPVGRTMWIGGLPHQVIGLLVKQGAILGESQDLVVYVPFRTAQKQLGSKRSIDTQVSLLVRAAGGVAGVERSKEEVVQIFRWLRHVPFRGKDPVGIVTAEMIQSLWRQISLTTFVVVILISGVSLLVGAIVVANIMLVSVVERTTEIGLRLALGARRADILRQFLTEAVVLCVAGGIIGTLLGGITSQVVDAQSPVPAALKLWVVVTALVVATVAGLVAGVFPAYRASRLTPIEALRHE